LFKKIKILQKVNPGSQELQEIMKKAKLFGNLAEGYADLEFALKYSVRNELPVKRLHEAIKLANKNILRDANSAISVGRQIIPEHVSQETMLDSEIDSSNAEQWGDIFLKKRYTPTVREALKWKKVTLIFEREKRNQEIIDFFKQKFDEGIESANIYVSNLDNLMLADEESVEGFELSHRHVEDKQRNSLVEEFEEIIETVSHHLAHFIYRNYIEKFVGLLNNVCEEDPSLFTTQKKVEHCHLEILALLKRVAIPLIRATLRWAHDNPTPRNSAGEELTKVVPWVAFDICDEENENTTPNLRQLLGLVNDWQKKKWFFMKKNVYLPNDIKKLKKNYKNSKAEKINDKLITFNVS